MLSQDLAIPILGGRAPPRRQAVLLPGLRRLAVVVLGASKDAEAWPAASWRGQPHPPPLEGRPNQGCKNSEQVCVIFSRAVLILCFFASFMWFMLLLGRFAFLGLFCASFCRKKMHSFQCLRFLHVWPHQPWINLVLQPNISPSQRQRLDHMPPGQASTTSTIIFCCLHLSFRDHICANLGVVIVNRSLF